MADVSIKYKGVERAAMNDSGTKTIKTSGKYCEGDIVVDYVDPEKPTQTKTATPSLSQQTVLPDSGNVLSGVTVNAITKELLATLDSDFAAENIKKNVDLFGLIGTLESGGGGGGAHPQKDVNFIDYDGTILHSYTAAEFAALTAMPDNPDHSNDIQWGGHTIALTSLGWNYTLAKAQAYVAKYGKLWIGQMYKPTDGKTYVCIRLKEGRTSPMLGICPKGTVDVDWGDGTAHDTLTGTSLTTSKWTPTHNYSAAGDYIIKLDVTSGTAQLYGVDTSSMYACLLRYTSGGNAINQGYQTSIKSVFVGSATSIGNCAFSNCYSLNAITIPDGVTSIGNYAFRYCYSLNAITIPDGVTSIGNYAFYYCNSFNAITIPDGVTSIGNYAFYACNSFNAITIPDGVTSIGNYAFHNCLSFNAITIPDGVTSIGSYAFQSCTFLQSITFRPVTPPTVSSSKTWANIPTDCIIYVPAASLETYKAATNYPDLSTYTYIGY